MSADTDYSAWFDTAEWKSSRERMKRLAERKNQRDYMTQQEWDAITEGLSPGMKRKVANWIVHGANVVGRVPQGLLMERSDWTREGNDAVLPITEEYAQLLYVPRSTK